MTLLKTRERERKSCLEREQKEEKREKDKRLGVLSSVREAHTAKAQSRIKILKSESREGVACCKRNLGLR